MNAYEQHTDRYAYSYVYNAQRRELLQICNGHEQANVAGDAGKEFSDTSFYNFNGKGLLVSATANTHIWPMERFSMKLAYDKSGRLMKTVKRYVGTDAGKKARGEMYDEVRYHYVGNRLDSSVLAFHNNNTDNGLVEHTATSYYDAHGLLIKEVGGVERGSSVMVYRYGYY